MNSKKKNIKKVEDPFRDFKHSTKEAFSFLVKKHGFQRPVISDFGHESSVRYYSNTTLVSVYYEWGTMPNVTLCELKKNGDRIIEGKSHSLIALLKKVSREGAERLLNLGRNIRAENLGPILFQCSEELKKHGANILKGDFSIFEKSNDGSARRTSK